MTYIAELLLDVAGEDRATAARLFAPVKQKDGSGWVCRFEVSEPVNYGLDVHGETSLQAVALALKGLSSVLYGSELYQSGRLGFGGEFGGYLGLPATSAFLDLAPYPF